MTPESAAFINAVFTGVISNFAHNAAKALLRSAFRSGTPQNAALLEAIRDSEAEFPSIEGASGTLLEWSKRPEVGRTIDLFATGEGVISLVELANSLRDSGFFTGENEDPTAEEVLTGFFRNLERRILRSEAGTAYALKKTEGKLDYIQTTASETKSAIDEVQRSLAASGLIPKSSEPDIPAPYLPVRDLLEGQQLRAALARLNRIRENFGPGTPAIQHYFDRSFRGWIHFHEHDLAKAGEYFNQALALMPEHIQAIRNLSVVRLMEGNREEALSLANSAMAIDAGHEDVVILRAQVLHATDGLEKALDYINNSGVAEGLKDYVRGFLFHAARRWKDAVGCLANAKRTYPERVEIRVVACSATGAFIGEEIESADAPPWEVTWLHREILNEAVQDAVEAYRLLQHGDPTPDKMSALSFACSLSNLAGKSVEARKYLACLDESLLRHADLSALFRIVQTESQLGIARHEGSHARLLIDRATGDDDKLASWGRQVLGIQDEHPEDPSTPEESESQSGPQWANAMQEAFNAYREERWQESALLFSQVITPTAPSRYRRYYLSALFKSSSFKEAISFIESVKQWAECDTVEFEIEASIWEATGDISRAIGTIAKAETMIQNATHWKLRRAHLELHRDMRENALAALPKPDDLGRIELGDLRYAVGLYSELGMPDVALRVGYRGLQDYFDEPEAHLAYLGLFIPHPQVLVSPDDPGVVSEGSVVTYSADATKATVLVDREPCPKCLEPCPTGLASRLLGHQVGDEIILREDQFGKTIARIEKITNKYVWLFNNCANGFQDRFPDDGGLRRIPFDPKDKSILDRLLPDDSARINQWREFYERGQLPISALAKLRGFADHQVYAALIGGQLGGVIAYPRNSDLLSSQQQAFENAPVVCLECTTLIAFALLDGLTVLSSAGKQMLVPQSLLDDLRQELLESRRSESREHKSLVRIDGTVGLLETTAEQVAERVRFLGRLISWIEKNTVVKPESLEVRDQLKSVESFLTHSTFSSLVIAKQEQCLLLSDDLTLRNIASQLFSINSSWSFPALASMTGAEGSGSDGETLLVRFFTLNYKFLPLTEDCLIKALQLDNNSVGDHVRAILRVVADPNVVIGPAIEMVTAAVRQVSVATFGELRRDELLQAFWKAIANRGNWQRDKLALSTSLARRFHLLPVHIGLIRENIAAWETQQIL